MDQVNPNAPAAICFSHRQMAVRSVLPLYNATLGYAGAKAALATYSKGLANGGPERCVRVSTVAPGFTETTALRRGCANRVVWPLCVDYPMHT